MKAKFYIHTISETMINSHKHTTGLFLIYILIFNNNYNWSNINS